MLYKDVVAQTADGKYVIGNARKGIEYDKNTDTTRMVLKFEPGYVIVDEVPEEYKDRFYK